MAQRNSRNLEDLTFVVKTFERFKCIKRLVRSIYRYYPHAKILIADDSRTSCKAYLEKKYGRKGLEVIELPYDMGLSYGRNCLVDRVKTEYFCLLDDDFVFDRRTDIAAAMELIREKDVDILSGYMRGYVMTKTKKAWLKLQLKHILQKKPLYAAYNYIGFLKLDADAHVLYCDLSSKRFPDYQAVDIVPNFFVGRTSAIRERNRWDEELKLNEHTDFFLRAKLHGLRVACTSRYSVQHRQNKPGEYESYRNRDYFKLFMEKTGIQKVISTHDGGEVEVQEI